MKGCDKLLTLLFLGLILSMSFIDAKIILPTQASGLQINIWNIETIPQGQDFTFVWDTSRDGMLLNNTQNNCSFFMIKQGSATQTFSNIDTPNAPGTYGLYQTVKGGNFSTLGTYNVQIDCYMPTNKSISGNALLQFDVTPSGEVLSLGQVFSYSLFLIFCLFMIYQSGLIIRENPISKDPAFNSQLYEERKKSEFTYYMKVLKMKSWVIGVFGVYLFLLLFLSLTSQLVFYLGFVELISILTNITQIMMWGLIPFCIFWIAYLIIHVYKTTTETLRYQFGKIGRGN